MKQLIFTVTNDLTYDQRMQRICGSLANNGYEVLLIGRGYKNSLPLTEKKYQQKRISCFFNSGFLFYAEYNLQLFFVLLFTKMDAICAIDLDTILACLLASLVKNKKRIYDAHELFTEQKEIVTRPVVHKCWMLIEKFAVPKFTVGYTVNQFIADELKRRYGVNYGIIRNLPRSSVTTTNQHTAQKTSKFILYQGAVNEGRSFETLIPAMLQVDAPLIIYGKGNFFSQVQQLIAAHKLEAKVLLKGFITPDMLNTITPDAYIAVTIFEQTGLNQYYSLSNRFFDYIMAGVPQICVNYPEYKTINDEYNVALMIDDVKSDTIAAALNRLLNHSTLHEQLRQNCVIARKTLNWENEEKELLLIYNQMQIAPYIG